MLNNNNSGQLKLTPESVNLNQQVGPETRSSSINTSSAKSEAGDQINLKAFAYELKLIYLCGFMFFFSQAVLVRA